MVTPAFTAQGLWRVHRALGWHIPYSRAAPRRSEPETANMRRRRTPLQAIALMTMPSECLTAISVDPKPASHKRGPTARSLRFVMTYCFCAQTPYIIPADPVRLLLARRRGRQGVFLDALRNFRTRFQTAKLRVSRRDASEVCQSLANRAGRWSGEAPGCSNAASSEAGSRNHLRGKATARAQWRRRGASRRLHRPPGHRPFGAPGPASFRSSHRRIASRKRPLAGQDASRISAGLEDGDRYTFTSS